MIKKREEAFQKIQKELAINRYEIELGSSSGDYSLNFHAENYYRDILNFVYGYQLENLNKNQINAPYVDLIDREKKLIIQVTSAKTKEKIEKTLQALKQKDYKDYNLKIFYLINKPKLNQKTIDNISEEYGINLKDTLFDCNDLLRDINDLDTDQLIKLAEKYFKNEKLYTKEIVLDLMINYLIDIMPHKIINYSMEDTTSIETKNKIKLNNLSKKISSQIEISLDYVQLLNKFDDQDKLVKLRYLIIENYYRDILEEFLCTKFKRNEIQNRSIDYLHQLSREVEINFNEVIANLYDRIKKEVIVEDFNAMNGIWILIAYYFEICDIGAKE